MPEHFPIFYRYRATQKGYHTMVVAEHCLMLYHIRGTGVYVKYVIDCRQDPKGMFLR